MNQPSGSGHPAWQEYLKDIPESLHGVVKGAFSAWDQNVQQRIQEVHNQYEPLKAYQPLAERNIPLERVGQALEFAQQVEQNPKAIVERMNEHYKLGFVPEEQVQRQALAPDPFDVDYSQQTAEELLATHPALKQIAEGLATMQQRFDEQDQRTQEEREAEEFEEYLDQLTAQTPYAEDDDAKMLITAFMQAGKTGEQALELVTSRFTASVSQQLEQQITNNNNEQLTNTDNPVLDAVLHSIGQQPPIRQTVGDMPQGNNQAPVVMDSSGNAGSGVPAAPIDFGKMKADDVNSVVAQALAQAQES